jgi:hypothetical protein
MGETALITEREKQEEIHITGSLIDFVRNYVTDQSEQHEGKVRLLLLTNFLLSSTRPRAKSREPKSCLGFLLSWCHKRKTSPNLLAPSTVFGFYSANSPSRFSVTLASTTVHMFEPIVYARPLTNPQYHSSRA